MTVLIEVRDSDGLIGRCDARCYDDKGDKCDCICGGMNHGKGLIQAVRLTKQHAEALVQEIRAEHPVGPELAVRLADLWVHGRG